MSCVLILNMHAQLVTCAGVKPKAKSGGSTKGNCPGAVTDRVEDLKKAGQAAVQAGNSPGAVLCFEAGLQALTEDRSLPNWMQEKGEIGVWLGDALEAAGRKEEASEQFHKVCDVFQAGLYAPQEYRILLK